jgi:hypothetical protein
VAEDALIGRELGRYRVESIIGSGGFATVYRAIDLALERPVALKVVDPTAHRNPTIARRFVLEGRAVASLDDPAIVPVYDAGENDGELEAREKLRGTPARRIRVLDRVFRSWGTLRHARLLGVEQLMACASDLRLGRWLGEFQGLRDEVLNGLALFGQPGHLGVRLGQELDEDAERWARAEWVRRQLTGEQEAGSGRPS